MKGLHGGGRAWGGGRFAQRWTLALMRCHSMPVVYLCFVGWESSTEFWLTVGCGPKRHSETSFLSLCSFSFLPSFFFFSFLFSPSFPLPFFSFHSYPFCSFLFPSSSLLFHSFPFPSQPFLFFSLSFPFQLLRGGQPQIWKCGQDPVSKRKKKLRFNSLDLKIVL